MRRRTTIWAIVGWIGLTGAVLGGSGRAAETGASAQTAPALGQATDLLPQGLERMGGAEEIVFAVRELYSDGHYYANFGHWSLDPKRMMYAPERAQPAKRNLRTGEVTVLVDDPRGGIRDPHVHYDGNKILLSYRPGEPDGRRAGRSAEQLGAL